MTYRGQIRNGVVVLDGDPKLPEGAQVELDVLDNQDLRKLWDGLRKLAGTVNMPPDTAENDDHYAHGAPKKRKS